MSASSTEQQTLFHACYLSLQTIGALIEAATSASKAHCPLIRLCEKRFRLIHSASIAGVHAGREAQANTGDYLLLRLVSVGAPPVGIVTRFLCRWWVVKAAQPRMAVGRRRMRTATAGVSLNGPCLALCPACHTSSAM